MQIALETCRYIEFLERSLLFTRSYAVEGGDTVALLESPPDHPTKRYRSEP
ncbi:MAG: hypothetical protein ACI8X5_001181 [Planctomycetota bacterium]|jgi:hypothetical protein